LVPSLGERVAVVVADEAFLAKKKLAPFDYEA
jgi:hypothetical protein